MTDRPSPEQSASDQPDPADQPGACRGCSQQHACRDVWSAANRGPFSPTGLIFASIAAFLLPLLGAAVGAALVAHRNRSSDFTWQMGLAALVGLLLGGSLGALIVHRIRKRSHA